MLDLIKNKNQKINSNLTLEVFNEGIKILEATYNKKYSNDQKNILYTLLSNYGKDFFIASIKQTIETHSYTTLPPIGEIIKNGKDQQNDLIVIRSLQIRNKIFSLIKDTTTTYILDDPITKKIVDLLGGLKYLGQLDPKELNILLTNYLMKTIKALGNNLDLVDFNDIILGNINNEYIKIVGDIGKITRILKQHNLTEEQKNKLSFYGINLPINANIKKINEPKEETKQQ